MKFTVEIEDFYLDSENDIESELKRSVIKNVVSQIEKSIEAKINDAILLKSKREIEKSLYLNIQKIVKEVVKTGLIQSRNSRDRKVTIEEYVREDFENNTGYSSPREQISKLAHNFGDELKKRYDLLFASQIVSKMAEHGLLKDEAVKKLLEKPEIKKP